MAKKMTTKTVLNGLIDLFSTPEAWTKHVLSETNSETGKPSYCLIGGIAQVTEGSPFRTGSSEVYKMIRKVGRALRFENKTFWSEMVLWNNADTTDHGKFMERLRHGLRRVESRYGHKKSSDVYVTDDGYRW